MLISQLFCSGHPTTKIHTLLETKLEKMKMDYDLGEGGIGPQN